jgi:hypothetical protein
MQTSFSAALDELIAYFNRRTMEVPDGFFDRNAQFTLNGVPFETLLGRTDGDPLVRMIARGAAGYRFAAKPLLHALETALVSRISATSEGECWRVRLALRGTLRGSGRLMDETVGLTIRTTTDGAIRRADVTIDQIALEAIRTARQT